MFGKAKESLNVRSAYGVSSGPSIVAVHDVRSPPSPDGKADTPGAGEVMSCISSVCSLVHNQRTGSLKSRKCEAYRLVNPTLSAGLLVPLTFEAGKAPGAAFCESSIA